MQKDTAFIDDYCPIEETIRVVGGRWKPVILFHLLKGPKRFNALRRCIPRVTQRMLTQHLRELEADGIIAREVREQVPPTWSIHSLLRAGHCYPFSMRWLSGGMSITTGLCSFVPCRYRPILITDFPCLAAAKVCRLQGYFFIFSFYCRRNIASQWARRYSYSHSNWLDQTNEDEMMTDLKIPVTKGEALAATLWEHEDAKGVIIIHPATAVMQEFYKGFAGYLHGEGFSVLTYDYRGTGRSVSGRLKNSRVSMSDWIEHDVSAVTAWASARFPHVPLMAVGHSVGGHAVLLSPATESLQAAVIIASHAGVTRSIKSTAERLRVWCLLRVVGPFLCRVFGYMPAKYLGLGEDLPAPVMRQWGRWSAMPGYFYDDTEWNAQERARRVTLPLLVMGFDDDPWANSEAITRLLMPVSNARVERREIQHSELGLPGIGHMGFFRMRCAEKLWPDVAQWLNRQSSGNVGTVTSSVIRPNY